MNTPITESVRRTLDEMQLSSLEEAYQYCMDRGIDPKALVMDTQPIAFESAADAYTLGTALAIFRGQKQLKKLQTLSVKAFKPALNPAAWQSNAKWVSVTVHWRLVY